MEVMEPWRQRRMEQDKKRAEFKPQKRSLREQQKVAKQIWNVNCLMQHLSNIVCLPQIPHEVSKVISLLFVLVVPSTSKFLLKPPALPSHLFPPRKIWAYRLDRIIPPTVYEFETIPSYVEGDKETKKLSPGLRAALITLWTIDFGLLKVKGDKFDHDVSSGRITICGIPSDDVVDCCHGEISRMVDLYSELSPLSCEKKQQIISLLTNKFMKPGVSRQDLSIEIAREFAIHK